MLSLKIKIIPNNNFGAKGSKIELFCGGFTNIEKHYISFCKYLTSLTFVIFILDFFEHLLIIVNDLYI
jgi:hypothetical protein